MRSKDRGVGIDSIGVYIPRLYVDLTGDWARVRAPALAEGDVRKLIGKVTEGVGVRRMAVIDAHQDCATLAAMAAKRAIDAAGIDPTDIDYLAVGTETTVDQSKSTAAYVLGMLERHYGVSLAGVGTPQFQFACIGATYALEAAASRIRAGDNAKPYSLVVASDVSKYPLATPGEYTQGAGAVALLVSQNPRLVTLEQGLSGTVTRDERDFFRPNWSQEAVVDGKYSIDVYLDCIEAAFAAFATRAERSLGGGADRLYDAIDHFLFHVPFPRMAEYAAARVLTSLWFDSPRDRARLAAEVPLVSTRPSSAGGSRPGPDAGPPGAGEVAAAGLRTGASTDGGANGAELRAWRKDVERAVARSSIFREAFARKVEPSLAFSRDIGNMYSGSLYLALASLLEHAGAQSLSGQRIVFGSYGSGASAKVFSGLVADGYESIAGKIRVSEDLRPEPEGGRRVPLSVSEYERLHALADSELACSEELAQKLSAGVALEPNEVAALHAAWTKPAWRVRPRGASVRPPHHEFALDHLGTSQTAQRTDLGYRYYVWAQ
ncbi:MAG TPA: hydroxymethylglutaryl-CoA synthase [Polyangiaceae bacterium]|nr:hydroxymethylglutaryl-CoA synthase [Polyangiaceae bacterium]